MLSLFSKMTLTLKIELFYYLLGTFAKYKSWSREKSENILCLDPYILFF